MNNIQLDPYQKRYLDHQERKKQTLLDLIRERHSDRVFADKKIEKEKIAAIREAIICAPSSCNRHAITSMFFFGRDIKSFISGFLVGGVGWIHRADGIILLVAEETAYKENLDYMKYLDTGFIGQSVYMVCTDLGLGCCFVNPNIRERQLKYFKDYFRLNENQTLTGAIAIGYKEQTED